MHIREAVFATATASEAKKASVIRFVLQITIDGLRGDLLNRYGDRFGKGEFRLLAFYRVQAAPQIALSPTLRFIRDPE